MPCWLEKGYWARVRGALVRVGDKDLGRRVFEDKLAKAGLWEGEVYLVCTNEAWKSIIEGLAWLVDKYSPECLISADIGGDEVLLGYEKKLGSYIIDTVAKAVLAWASREYGVKGVIAVGGIGAEGGGTALNLLSLYATFSYLNKIGAILGAWAPEPSHITPAQALLHHAESGMLPIYLAAVEGRRTVEIR